MGFVVLMNFLCAALPFEIAIKNVTPMGFVNLQTSSAPLFLLKWLSKAEGDGVRKFANILCVPLPFEIAIKTYPNGVRLLHKSCKHPLPALPSPWRGVGGEALMLRLYSKLGIFLWFSLLFRIFHQA